MLRHTHHRRLIATVATAAALAATAPAAPAMPPRENGASVGATPASEPERVRVLRVQVDDGLDWSDAGIGAAGMLALVLLGFGGVHALRAVPSRGKTTAHS